MSFHPKLEEAWSLIISGGFLERAKGDAQTKPRGISVFEFLKEKNDDGTNCQVGYVEKSTNLWNDLVCSKDKSAASAAAGHDSDAFEKTFVEGESYAVCVAIPSPDSGEEDVKMWSVRIFSIVDDKELSRR